MNQLLLILPTIAFATGVFSRARIWGGQEAIPGQFPFIVALNDPDQFCNGIIIAPNWILTAAHCLSGLTLDAEIYVGSHINNVNGTAYKFEQTLVHELYDDIQARNDIGLVKIDGTLEYNDRIQAIEIGDFTPNTTCTSVGWGATETENYPTLQFLELTAIDIKYCESFTTEHPTWMALGPNQMCALGNLGKGSCYGDAGGPLICDGKLAAVLSYGIVNECGAAIPTVYTRAAAYIDWIQTHIQTRK